MNGDAVELWKLANKHESRLDVIESGQHKSPCDELKDLRSRINWMLGLMVISLMGTVVTLLVVIAQGTP